jgi:putative peptidoglycan lipid II flippase
LRTRLLAAYFGGNIDVLETYIAATKVPEFIFEVVVLSAISISFIPIFSDYLVRGQKKIAWLITSQVVTVAISFFLIIAFSVFILADNLAILIAPGKTDPDLQKLTASLIRVMIIPQFFFTISILLSSVLQSFQRFFLPATAAIVYNLGIIFGIIVLSPTLGIYGPAWGMVIGAFAHMLIQLPLVLKLGMRFEVNLNFFNKDVLNVWKMASPRILGLAVSRIGDMVNISFASLISTGSVVAFNFAQLLQFFPITLFASSFAQATLPTIASEYSLKRISDFKTTILTSLHQMMFLLIPVTVILAILRIPAIRLVFGAGQFPWPLTVLTGQTLIVFTIGLGAQGAALLLIRAFYAMHDPKTPVIIGVLSSGVNIGLSILFIKIFNLSVLYLAGAYTAANILNALLLLYFLDKKVGNFDRNMLFIPFLKMIISASIMALFLYIPVKILDQVIIDTTRTIGLLILTGIAGFCGLSVYLLLTWILGVSEAGLLVKLTAKIIGSKKFFAEKQIIEEVPRQ